MSDIIQLRDNEMRHTLISAIALCVFTLVAGVVSIIVSFALVPDLWGWVSAGVFIVGGMAVMMVFIIGIRRVWGYADWAEPIIAPVEYEETNEKPVAPPAPVLLTPALPAPSIESETIRYTSPSGGVQEIPRKLVRGFDVRDLDFLCQYLANGGRFTESAMEYIPLMHTGGKMGKAQEGTHYTRFIDWLVDAEIIVGRAGKKSGTLAVLEAGEMLRKLKEAK